MVKHKRIGTSTKAVLQQDILRQLPPVWTADDVVGLLNGVVTKEQVLTWTGVGIIPPGWYTQRGATLFRSCVPPLILISVELSRMLLRAKAAGGVDRGEARSMFEKLVPEIPSLWIAQLAGYEPTLSITQQAPSVFSETQPVEVKFHGLAQAEAALRKHVQQQA
jgi:hypothetical protein